MRVAAVSLFTLGAAVAGVLTYGGLALVAAAFDARFVVRVLAIAWIAFCLCWHAFGFVKVPLGRESIQANKQWARKGAGGLFYFGALLGNGLLTQMTTPLVLGGALAAASSSVWWALLYGAGFGAGRSLPTFSGAMVGLGNLDPGELAARMISRRRTWATRLAGSVAGLLALGLLLSAFRWGMPLEY
ncbi:MAG: hypothetical protein J2P27_03650 [Actinobacteria bacterium]|nr:hypothetical protein [Actinomycetota bacterium]